MLYGGATYKAMQKSDLIPKSYRFPPDIGREMDAFRREQELPPKEVTIVVTALREFFDRKRKGRK